MRKILNFDAEILEKFPQIKAIKKGDNYFISGENEERVRFITLSTLGYHFANEELAIEHYKKELFNFIESQLTDNCELFWRMMPEIEIHNNIMSRLLIKPITK